VYKHVFIVLVFWSKDILSQKNTFPFVKYNLENYNRTEMRNTVVI